MMSKMLAMNLFSVVFGAMAAVAKAFPYQEGYSRDIFGEAGLNAVSPTSCMLYFREYILM